MHTKKKNTLKWERGRGPKTTLKYLRNAKHRGRGGEFSLSFDTDVLQGGGRGKGMSKMV